VTTGRDGRFRVVLPAGGCIVRPAAAERLLPRADPVQVTLVPGPFAHVTVNFDSGMR
jgi:hypothetical protein